MGWFASVGVVSHQGQENLHDCCWCKLRTEPNGFYFEFTEIIMEFTAARYLRKPRKPWCYKLWHVLPRQRPVETDLQKKATFANLWYFSWYSLPGRGPLFHVRLSAFTNEGVNAFARKKETCRSITIVCIRWSFCFIQNVRHELLKMILYL